MIFNYLRSYFNIINIIFAVSEMGLEKVSNDYQEVLEEFIGNADKISELKSEFNDNSKSWDQRWEAFTETFKELKTTNVIQRYYLW